jgi:hypothetical protein
MPEYADSAILPIYSSSDFAIDVFTELIGVAQR